MEWFLYDNDLHHERVKLALVAPSGLIKFDSSTSIYSYACILHDGGLWKHLRLNDSFNNPQSAFTYSKLTIEALEQGVKYVQS